MITVILGTTSKCCLSGNINSGYLKLVREIQICVFSFLWCYCDSLILEPSLWSQPPKGSSCFSRLFTACWRFHLSVKSEFKDLLHLYPSYHGGPAWFTHRTGFNSGEIVCHQFSFFTGATSDLEERSLPRIQIWKHHDRDTGGERPAEGWRDGRDEGMEGWRDGVRQEEGGCLKWKESREPFYSFSLMPFCREKAKGCLFFSST